MSFTVSNRNKKRWAKTRAKNQENTLHYITPYVLYSLSYTLYRQTIENEENANEENGNEEDSQSDGKEKNDDDKN